jgi:hypothetical protein
MSPELKSLYPRWCPRCAASVDRQYKSVRLPGGREGRVTVACIACKWALAIANDGVWQRCRVSSATTTTATTESEAYEWRLLEQR